MNRRAWWVRCAASLVVLAIGCGRRASKNLSPQANDEERQRANLAFEQDAQRRREAEANFLDPSGDGR
jgi:hypothetical protein